MKDAGGAEADRREFLKSAGKFAVVAPPAVTFLLSTTMASSAIAQSIERTSKGNEGCGNGPDPDPTDANPDRCPPQVPTDPA